MEKGINFDKPISKFFGRNTPPWGAPDLTCCARVAAMSISSVFITFLHVYRV